MNGAGAVRALLPLAAAGALVLATLPAQAVVVSFNTAAAFTSATALPGLDLFTDLVDGTSYSSPLTRSAGSYSYQVSSTDGLFGIAPGGNPALSSDGPTAVLTFSAFTSTVRGFAADFFPSAITGAFASGGVTITANDSGGGSTTVTLTPTAVGSGSFAGFLSDVALSSVVFRAVQPGVGALWPAIDSLTLAQPSAVPEPATWLMALAGAGALGLALRRRSARS